MFSCLQNVARLVWIGLMRAEIRSHSVGFCETLDYFVMNMCIKFTNFMENSGQGE